jgi:hypothetical protein
MTKRQDASDLDETSADPAASFGHPAEILERDDLSYETKLHLLQRWQADLRNAGAADEDQEGDGRLDDIALAIEQLQTDAALDPDKPEGAPSGQGYRPSD